MAVRGGPTGDRQRQRGVLRAVPHAHRRGAGQVVQRGCGHGPVTIGRGQPEAAGQSVDELPHQRRDVQGVRRGTPRDRGGPGPLRRPGRSGRGQEATFGGADGRDHHTRRLQPLERRSDRQQRHRHLVDRCRVESGEQETVDTVRAEEGPFEVGERRDRDPQPVDGGHVRAVPAPCHGAPEREAGPSGQHRPVGTTGCRGERHQPVVQAVPDARQCCRMQGVDHPGGQQVVDTRGDLGDRRGIEARGPRRRLRSTGRHADAQVVFGHVDHHRRLPQAQAVLDRERRCGRVTRPVDHRDRDLERGPRPPVQLRAVLGPQQPDREGRPDLVGAGAEGTRREAPERLLAQLEQPLAEPALPSDGPAEAETDLTVLARAEPPAPSRLGDDQAAGGGADVHDRAAHLANVPAVPQRMVTVR